MPNRSAFVTVCACCEILSCSWLLNNSDFTNNYRFDIITLRKLSCTNSRHYTDQSGCLLKILVKCCYCPPEDQFIVIYPSPLLFPYLYCCLLSQFTACSIDRQVPEKKVDQAPVRITPPAYDAETYFSITQGPVEIFLSVQIASPAPVTLAGKGSSFRWNGQTATRDSGRFLFKPLFTRGEEYSLSTPQQARRGEGTAIRIWIFLRVLAYHWKSLCLRPRYQEKKSKMKISPQGFHFIPGEDTLDR